jgi:nucleoside phosphorylase
MFVDQAVYKMGHKEDKKILHLQSISQHKEREKEREEQENNIFYSLRKRVTANVLRKRVSDVR